jgi:diguanylate cyclase (GGDEF)-like protein/PAS domain S-box-containing protein
MNLIAKPTTAAPHRYRPALKFALAYAALASLWILLSDAVVALLLKNHSVAAFHLANTLKGWGFVAVTAVLLYCMIRRALNQSALLAEHKNAILHEKIRAQTLLSKIAENSTYFIFVKDLSGRYLFVNQALLNTVGKAEIDCLGHSDFEVFSQEEAALFGFNDQTVCQENRVLTFEEILHAPDSDKIFSTTKGALPDEAGQIFGTFGIAREVTERIKAESAHRLNALHLQRLSNFNSLLSEANEAIARADDEASLLQTLCALAIDRAHLQLIWIGVPDAAGWFKPLAQAGDIAYLAHARISALASKPEGEGSAGLCWRSRKPVYNFSFEDNPQASPWVTEAARHGFSASASLPTFRNGQLWAEMGAYLGHGEIIDAEIEKILNDLSQDIGFGLDRLDLTHRERDSNAFNIALLNSLTVGVNVMRYPDRIIERINNRMLELAGVDSHAALVGLSSRAYYADEALFKRAGEFAQEVLTKGHGKSRDVPFVRADGRIIFMNISGQRIESVDGCTRIVWTHVDVTERRHSEQIIRELSEARASLLANTTAGISLVRYPERIFTEVNQGFLKIMGYAHADEVLGQTTAQIYPSLGENHRIRSLAKQILQSGHGQIRDLCLVRRDGQTIYADVSGQSLRDVATPEHTVIAWTLVDVSERYLLARALADQAQRDPLTGLPNRRALEDEFTKAIARAQRHQRMLAMVMLDLDDFKPINDTYGHVEGDRVLRIIAERLQAHLRRTDFVARLGGDEFVLLIEDAKNWDEINIALNKVGEAIHAPLPLQGGPLIQVSFSSGVATYPEIDTDSPDTLMRAADQALYENKAHKSDRLRFWTCYGQSTQQRQNMAQSRLYAGGVRVFYQPIMDNLSRRMVGIEALARLSDTDGRIITPATFLPQLTKDDLWALTQQLFTQALHDLKALDHIHAPLWLSFNLDPQNISDTCIHWLRDTLAHSAIPADRITEEILESSNFEEQQAALNHLVALKDLGVLLALDDVGSAYSSLLRLRDLPIDKIKLDQSFVRGLANNPEDIQFVKAMMDLAIGLELDLVVEGVETDDILDAMTVLGVQTLQGFGIARPMPLPELIDFLQRPDRPKRVHPTSLLGLYAKQIHIHTLLKASIKQNPGLINQAFLADASACPIHHHLERLGVTRDSPIKRLHE